MAEGNEPPYAAVRFNLSQVRRLQAKAEEFIQWEQREQEVNILFRDKPATYFQKIESKHAGVMEPYDKDNNGDPKSPINGKIKGLFFSASKMLSGALPPDSPFGNTRLTIPAERIINTDNNIYFADFYCKQRHRKHNHFISLVVTEPGSLQDDYCAEHLPTLNLSNSKFMWLDSVDNVIRIRTKPGCYVEILYCGDINLHDDDVTVSYNAIQALGVGQSTKHGIPKNPRCPFCNITDDASDDDDGSDDNDDDSDAEGGDDDDDDVKEVTAMTMKLTLNGWEFC